MPSIINASSSGSGGIVQTADASGVLQLQSNGTVALNIDTSANVIIGATSGSNKLVVSQTKATTSAETYNLLRLTLGGTRAINDTIGIRFGAAGSSVDIGAITCVSGADDALYGTLKFATRNYNTDTLLDAMTIDNRGRVTAPYQPMFSAFATNGTGLTTDTTRRIMPFQTEATDVGGNYDTTTSRFTAPVAGTYFFQFFCLQLNNTATHFYFYKNGAQLVPATGDSRAITASLNEGNVAGTGLFTLAAGDYVQIYYNSDSGGNVYGGHGGFSGFLVG